jgi:putative transposase
MPKKRFNESEIHKILQEVNNDNTTISSIINKYGISQATFYNWRAKYSNLSSSETVQKSKLKKENKRLKLMFAELSLENLDLKAQLRMLKEQ